MFFDGKGFQFQLRAEAVFPVGSGLQVLQARMRRAAHPALSGAILAGHHFIRLALETNCHSGAQLRCNDHRALPRSTLSLFDQRHGSAASATISGVGITSEMPRASASLGSAKAWVRFRMKRARFNSAKSTAAV